MAATPTELKVTNAYSLDEATRCLSCASGEAQDPVRLSFQKGDAVCFPRFDDQLQSFLRALARTKPRIDSVSIQPDFLSAITVPATATRFCQAIGHIPSLLHLEWSPTGQRRIPLGVLHLTRVLEGARALESLVCHWTVLEGRTSEFVQLAASLHSHPTLQKTLFKSCSLRVRTSETALCVGPILEALRTVPNLKELVLSGALSHFRAQAEQAQVAPTLLPNVCRHPNLTNLTLQESINPGPCLVQTMADIRFSSSLTSLSLELGKARERECILLGQVIRFNQRLASLSLGVYGVKAQFDCDPHLLHIIRALEENSSMTNLTIRSGFCRYNYVPGSGIQKAILSILETKNTTLMNLTFSPPPKMIDGFLSDLDFYLTLNRSGRKCLLENPDAKPTKWVDALTDSSNNVSALFYFLSRNPTLCKINRKRKDPSTPLQGEVEEASGQRPNKKRRTG